MQWEMLQMSLWNYSTSFTGIVNYRKTRCSWNPGFLMWDFFFYNSVADHIRELPGTHIDLGHTSVAVRSAPLQVGLWESSGRILSLTAGLEHRRAKKSPWFETENLQPLKKITDSQHLQMVLGKYFLSFARGFNLLLGAGFDYFLF